MNNVNITQYFISRYTKGTSFGILVFWGFFFYNPTVWEIDPTNDPIYNLIGNKW